MTNEELFERVVLVSKERLDALDKIARASELILSMSQDGRIKIVDALKIMEILTGVGGE